MIDDDRNPHESTGFPAVGKLRRHLIRTGRSNGAFWDLAFNAMLTSAMPQPGTDDETQRGLLIP